MAGSQVKILRLRISGLVQGVGYRAFFDSEARRLGLEGWVRNRSDRSVEAVIAGPEAAVGEMIVAARRGPYGSRVEDIEMAETDAAALAAGRAGRFSVLVSL
jgi:acylphosphatase